ncbi:DNA-binding response regulator [Candidatus Saccharibacteria bacterium CG11_big_fil_rev_8_21_14_0_20_41_19]|nr:response regulator transcription factor [Candidatus Saccharibacteria bacterium]OIP86343.1 MAG: DNA-binding response regulator [Candidatus Saccharibacteria bacterium CG2_30_41_52]PIQ71126.1 MAG: DNA-binding response regulator [Candidatus Saccharibacteria bacterium CG11_big_fil_rev_8_21_14_0_20_41_19]PIZ59942.1 MAG: DNA-binding response regulator [Candidatus Saccharibacteria bacterium CG_4_10_14_0_2_um_filter_41_11]PJE65972.1 MAG: DNA-binding response regulator [Candidatus Saccharibacteria bac
MRVLIIEDEHKIAHALRKALQQDNYAVDVSYDGDDGYAMATTEPYDAAIIDWMIPGEYNGIAIVKAMRKMKIHTPVLLLSAKGTINDRTTGLDAGADDYLVKPFALEELLARVRALLRRPVEVQQTILTAGDLSLNTVTFVVKRGDKEISLTGKEFALLEYLLRNQDRPHTKDVIISHVWDYNADVLPNTVEVYMKYLRQKIDDPFDTKLLHTSRGFGYKIEVK